MAFTTKSGHDSQGNEKIYFLAFLSLCSLQSVIERELLDNLKAYEFELTEDEMQKIFGLNKNLRKIVPVNKLKDGSVVLRDGKSRHFPFHYEEKM